MQTKAKKSKKWQQLIRYQSELEKYHQEGLSTRAISKIFYQTHKLKVSYQTVNRFLKAINSPKTAKNEKTMEEVE